MGNGRTKVGETNNYADEIDRAAALTERMTEIAIENARANAAKRELPPTGFCHNCEEEFEPGSTLIFCDGDCRHDYEYRKKCLSRR